jgi:transaldolase
MTRLHLYADSADVEQVDRLLRFRLVRGVTTNPTILLRAGRKLSELPGLYERWAQLGAEEIFFQVWGSTRDELIARGQEIASFGRSVVVKVPATPNGFEAAGILIRQDIPILMTAVYGVPQALAAASIGARYIAPYLGRLEDSGQDGLAMIEDMHRVLEGSDTEVLAASLRSPQAIVDLAKRGIRFFTAAPEVLMASARDDQSDAAARAFEADIAELPKSED